MLPQSGVTASRSESVVRLDIRRFPWIRRLAADYAFDYARVAEFFAGVVVPGYRAALRSDRHREAIDRRQDIDYAALSGPQQAALRLWVGAGGRLVLVGGTTGVGSMAGLPADMVPFVPQRTVDVSTDDLRSLLGTLPAGATTVPAVAGTLQRGAVIARTGDLVYAAQAGYGQGAVTIIGVNPATSWLAGSDAAGSLWRRALPLSAGTFVNPFIITDEYVFQNALYNLPAVALPPIEQLFVLLLAYIALIGQRVADILKVSREAVRRQTTENALRLFEPDRFNETLTARR